MVTDLINDIEKRSEYITLITDIDDNLKILSTTNKITSSLEDDLIISKDSRVNPMVSKVIIKQTIEILGIEDDTITLEDNETVSLESKKEILKKIWVKLKEFVSYLGRKIVQLYRKIVEIVKNQWGKIKDIYADLRLKISNEDMNNNRYLENSDIVKIQNKFGVLAYLNNSDIDTKLLLDRIKYLTNIQYAIFDFINILKNKNLKKIVDDFKKFGGHIGLNSKVNINKLIDIDNINYSSVVYVKKDVGKALVITKNKNGNKLHYARLNINKKDIKRVKNKITEVKDVMPIFDFLIGLDFNGMLVKGGIDDLRLELMTFLHDSEKDYIDTVKNIDNVIDNNFKNVGIGVFRGYYDDINSSEEALRKSKQLLYDIIKPLVNISLNLANDLAIEVVQEIDNLIWLGNKFR